MVSGRLVRPPKKNPHLYVYTGIPQRITQTHTFAGLERELFTILVVSQIKGKTGMPGMKVDMAGSAAVLAGFKASVEQNYAHPLSAILCLAENAIGPTSVRPDDIITMYSGKTVEVNNTDAEGRLVLADGAAWADLQPDAIIDIATLTGAAATTVGKESLHCILMTQDLKKSQFKADLKQVKYATHYPTFLKLEERVHLDCG